MGAPNGINLIARKADLRDLASCLALHESLELPYAETSRKILPNMWQASLSNGTMQIFLVENRAGATGSRVISFNAFIFVTDEFCSEARSTLRPYFSVELARRYCSRRLPVLNREQIARANADAGLNVIVCFEGSAHDGFSLEQVFAVRAKQSDALRLGLSGYRIKEFLAYPVGEDALRWMLNAGARIRRHNSNHFRNSMVLGPLLSQQPYLVGLTKKEALAHPGSSVADLFIYTPPRFLFSRSQRVLLQHALRGETCDTLATSLSVSRWTVKKRWHAIYERVADVDSELLPSPIADGPASSSRGTERRRHLLNYLRQHLEELRPFKSPQRQTSHNAARSLTTKIRVATR